MEAVVPRLPADTWEGSDLPEDSFPFRFAATPQAPAASPEALFSGLRKRSPNIPYLWSHQADILRSYHAKSSARNLALELPTGAGKTLIGLMIGEWQRQANGLRVAYLCPTRQLAHQVGAQAAEYGIGVRVLVGPQRDYPPGHFSDFTNARTIAVTTYAGLFNSNPRISDPQILILDDAHSAEPYIAGLWTLTVSRAASRASYEAILQLYAGDIPPDLLVTLRDNEADPASRNVVDLLPTPRVARLSSSLISLLSDAQDIDNAPYVLPLLRDHLDSCGVYLSWGELLIRPWIPPSLTHEPFASAEQRIYMSATLGGGGELERSIGVPRIERIPAPEGWDSRGMGRRLFLFPDRSFTPKVYQPWVSGFLAQQERVLVLTASRSAQGEFEKLAETPGTHPRFLHASDVEESLDSFVSQSGTVLVLTARYDGIDLPGDACRALVVFGLPTATNLQERFLWSRLGLRHILADTIATRITQAAGRCTRSPTDYSVVLMVGSELTDFCLKSEHQALFHPELRAELQFGLDNSDQTAVDTLEKLAEIFMERGSQWAPAESDIAARKGSGGSAPPGSVAALGLVAKDEVEYQYDLWRKDYASALTHAGAVVDQLGGDKLAGYRALWSYFAGSASYLQGVAAGDKLALDSAAARFRSASQAVRNVSWFAQLSHEMDAQWMAEEPPLLLTLAAEFVYEYILSLGVQGKKFERALADLSDDIEQNQADRFDRAVVELGRMLGFHAEKPEGNGAPDGVWQLSNHLILLFEGKSSEGAQGLIPISDVRQAQGHRDWYRARRAEGAENLAVTVLLTHRDRLDPEALPHAEGIYYVRIAEVRTTFARAAAMLRAARSRIVGLEAADAVAIISEEFHSAGLTPTDVYAALTGIPLAQRAR